MLLTKEDLFNLILNTIKSLRFIKYPGNTIDSRYINDENNPFFELVGYDTDIDTICNIFLHSGAYVLGDGFYLQLLNLVLDRLQYCIFHNTNQVIKIYRYSTNIKICLEKNTTASSLFQIMNTVNDIVNMNPVHKHIGDKYYTLDDGNFYKINEEGELVKIK